MTAAQYRAAIAKLGLSQQGAATLFGVSLRTSQNWALGDYPVPDVYAKLLRLLLSGKITIQDVEEARR